MINDLNAGGAGSADVQYEWIAIDTQNSGVFKGEFEVVDSGGKPETFPNNTQIEITIVPDQDSIT